MSRSGANKGIGRWLNGFAQCVRLRDFEGGKHFFHEKVYCFGSKAAVCESLDQLVERQWKKIWPNITGFRFDLKQAHYQISKDGLTAVVMTPWVSVGYHGNKRPFNRRGRVTLVLARKNLKQPWRALHSHYSLYPGISSTTKRTQR